ncbi:hypothetical protein FKV75_02405 [Weissella paramesenteroides]|uniref:hypothetical protein n=1 Tax=Weissella paramesenteroides TaxID=1249 RepID=UPI00123C0622|nr:hypothetical protein [Weissella paramesenteroides]KAA8439144.1 hypothetical protein FKV81_08660 [Weissella paramesenteroides]KAA8440148.1 hypothetical protein FKV77_08795 [Weissella paramesenteroides]KAA8443941.1 hypothetical protein FKV75_02405 [Weissella paramesenteroides]KAA8446422.1 hypothetical protein FKV76_06015 [Weissella paramesenteroides]KAA8451492.1 hypothetical protein FKV74_02405 [Weissella paramesenteroides]
MFEIIIDILEFVMFISAIGTFVVLKPLFKTFTKSQKVWTIIFVTSSVILFLMTNIPDFIKGFTEGINDK